VNAEAQPNEAGWRADLQAQPGLGIVRASVAGTVGYAIVAVLATAFTDSLGLLVAVVSGVLFFAGTGAFLWAYAIAIGRSRHDLIGMGGLFFLAGSAPPVVQRVMMGSLGAEVVVAVVTASLRTYTELAFGVLVPMWGLGLAGLWGARHGVFPRRETDPPASSAAPHGDGGEDVGDDDVGATGT
jgi:hypothetical protein